MASKSLPFTLTVTEVVPVPDFFLALNPLAQTVPMGTVATYALTFSEANGFTGLIDLAVTGLPEGAVASFDNNPATVEQTVTISITTTGVAAGTYNLVLTADGVIV